MGHYQLWHFFFGHIWAITSELVKKILYNTKIISFLFFKLHIRYQLIIFVKLFSFCLWITAQENISNYPKSLSGKESKY